MNNYLFACLLINSVDTEIADKMIQCVNHPLRGYPKTYASQFTEPLGRRFKSPRKNQMTVNSPVNTRFKYNSHRIQTDVCLNSNHICQSLFKTDPMTITEPMTITARDINK